MDATKCNGVRWDAMIEQLKHTYSDGIYHKTVVILGNYPPPLGGVSVHIQRVMHKLRQQNNLVHHFDTLNRSSMLGYAFKLLLFLCKKKPDIVYYHTVDLNARIIEFAMLVLLKSFVRYRLVIVEHNCRHLYMRSIRYKKKYTRCMRLVDHLVLIGHSTYQSYQDNQMYMPAHTTIEAAFLSPKIDDEAIILATYPKSVLDFMTMYKSIITINAFQLTILNGKDLYGIDQSIELLYRLKKTGHLVGLCIVLGNIGNEPYYHILKERIKVYGLEFQCRWMIGQKELWPLLKRSTIFLRPTLSDADSVSVREALFFNVPVVASDVCTRPMGVIVARVGDIEDLYAKVNSICSNLHA